MDEKGDLVFLQNVNEALKGEVERLTGEVAAQNARAASGQVRRI